MAGDDERARPCPHSGLEHLEGVQVQVVRGLVDDKHLRPSSSGPSAASSNTTPMLFLAACLVVGALMTFLD